MAELSDWSGRRALPPEEGEGALGLVSASVSLGPVLAAFAEPLEVSTLESSSAISVETIVAAQKGVRGSRYGCSRVRTGGRAPFGRSGQRVHIRISRLLDYMQVYGVLSH
jgi:hypothetical protein